MAHLKTHAMKVIMDTIPYLCDVYLLRKQYKTNLNFKVKVNINFFKYKLIKFERFPKYPYPLFQDFCPSSIPAEI